MLKNKLYWLKKLKNASQTVEGRTTSMDNSKCIEFQQMNKIHYDMISYHMISHYTNDHCRQAWWLGVQIRDESNKSNRLEVHFNWAQVSHRNLEEVKGVHWIIQETGWEELKQVGNRDSKRMKKKMMKMKDQRKELTELNVTAVGNFVEWDWVKPIGWKENDDSKNWVRVPE